ncbi:MAG TPA: OsmC family protein [Longimicrobiales bacterium]|nr:OsmC family protein [Longimicrobiales bacterium]
MATKRAVLDWTGEGLEFRGGVPGGPPVVIDSDGRTGPSPMDAVLLGLAGCMGVDLVMILEKGRVPLGSVTVDVEGDRAEDAPRRYTAVRMTYRISGPEPEHHGKVHRAVELSRDRYCSVLHSLRPDLDLDIQVEIA